MAHTNACLIFDGKRPIVITHDGRVVDNIKRVQITFEEAEAEVKILYESEKSYSLWLSYFFVVEQPFTSPLTVNLLLPDGALPKETA